MSRRTLEQERAQNALSCARRLSGSGNDTKKYRSYVDSLGPAIVMNGLGQALATELAAGDEHETLYKNLERWLCRAESGVYEGSKDLLSSITGNDEDQYLLAQVEALAWLEWHKKFCRALLGNAGR